MQNRSSRAKDINQLAKSIVDQSTGEIPKQEKNPAAVSLGRLGGLKGGVVRAKVLTPEQRKEIASRAAKTRWSKQNKQDEHES